MFLFLIIRIKINNLKIMKNLVFVVILILVIGSTLFTNCKKQPCDCETKSDTIKKQVIDSILIKGLVAYYPFTGNAIDSSGNGHNGTVYSASLTTNRFGTPNSAYAFNGDSAYIKVADATSLRLANTDFTISAWIYLDSIIHTHNVIISKRAAGSKTGYILSIERIQDSLSNALRISFQVSSGSDPKILSQTTISLNQWNHIVIRYNLNTKTIDIFLNNKPDVSLSNFLSPNASAANDLLVGNDAVDKTSFFQGKIDDIRIYNRALSDSEISELYNLTY